MHDIRWICENPDAFDRALARRGLAAESACSSRSTRSAARRSSSRTDAGASQRGLQRDRRGKEEQGRSGCSSIDGRGCGAQGADPGAGGRGEEILCRTERRARGIRTCRRAKCRTARTRPATSNTITSVRSAIIRSSRSSISSSAKRLASWISRLPRSFLARALSCSRAGLRAWSARSVSSSSMCIRMSTATPRSRHRC